MEESIRAIFFNTMTDGYMSKSYVDTKIMSHIQMSTIIHGQHVLLFGMLYMSINLWIWYWLIKSSCLIVSFS